MLLLKVHHCIRISIFRVNYDFRLKIVLANTEKYYTEGISRNGLVIYQLPFPFWANNSFPSFPNIRHSKMISK